ncbi:MAG: LacI family transcriptional regulator [Fimbriimonadales bacterium]|nr:LacI family transcriptional regulator [Fimbriimonadales bacterium]
MRPSRKNPTIRDVAKAAGVSIATVSHVLNDRREKVSNETRERVMRAVRELRYRLPPKEDRQTAIPTHNVAFVVSDLMPPLRPEPDYMVDALLAAIAVLASRGYSLTFVAERVWDAVGEAARRKFDGRCDGVLLLAPPAFGEGAKLLWERGLPVASIGARLKVQGVSNVDVDNHRVGELAAELFLKHGHRKVAYVADWNQQVSTYERFEGFLQAFEAAGMPDAPIGVVLDEPPSPEQVRQAQSRSLKQTWSKMRYLGREIRGADAQGLLNCLGSDVTGILFWDDGMARHWVTQLVRAGVRIPEDLSVIGVNNLERLVCPEPRITSIAQDVGLISRTATSILLAHIEDPERPAENVLIAPELVDRGSVAAPRKGPLVLRDPLSVGALQ